MFPSMQGMYTPKMAAQIARIRYQNFQAWAKANLIHGSKFAVGKKQETYYSYRDLLLIRFIVALRSHGISARAIKTALDTVASLSSGERDAWMKWTFYVTNGLVVAIPPTTDTHIPSPLAISKGPQTMALVFFPELISKLREELIPAKFKYIDIDPEVLGGMPRIKGTRIPTGAVTAAFESGQDPISLYPKLSPEQVDEAKAYEEFLKAA